MENSVPSAQLCSEPKIALKDLMINKTKPRMPFVSTSSLRNIMS